MYVCVCLCVCVHVLQEVSLEILDSTLMCVCVCACVYLRREETQGRQDRGLLT